MLKLKIVSMDEIPEPTVLSSVIGIATMAVRRSEHHSKEDVERYIKYSSETLIKRIKEGMSLK